MMIDNGTTVSLEEAKENFSHVARLVDERGSAVIMKNNVPRYVLIDIQQLSEAQPAGDADVLAASQALIAQNLEAYEVLAK